MELVINVQHYNGNVEVRHHFIKLGTGISEPEVEAMVQEWSEKLNNERWLNWEIELCDDNGSVEKAWEHEDLDQRPIFYMLTQEGYAWNSEIREQMDIHTYKLYRRASNA